MNAIKIALGAAALSLALTVSAFAAPTTYKTDANHTFVRFSYSHLGFSTQESRFNKVSGEVTFDPTNKSGSVDISIDTKSAVVSVVNNIVPTLWVRKRLLQHTRLTIRYVYYTIVQQTCR